MTRAFRALVGREIRRGWSRERVILAGGLIAALAAAVTSPSVALVIGICSAVATLIVPFAPIADIRSDKMQGDLEFDRMLPVDHRAIALARFAGVAVRLLPVPVLGLSLMVALARSPDASPESWLLVFPLSLAGWLVLTAATWAFMAINVRWNLRRLWWVPMTIAFGPRVAIALLPPAAKRAIADTATHLARGVVAFALTPIGGIVMVLLVFAIPAGVLVAAVALFASGLDRYRHETAISESLRLPAPRCELGAIGRGPVLAVARCSIRLATEQPRRRLLLFGVFFALLLFGSREIKVYAQFYVRTLAAMLPGAVVLQLTTARARGYLESMRQLPHPSRAIALGYLLAVAVLSVPGAAVWILARGLTGTPPTVTNVVALMAWLIGASWLASVASVWLTSRRTAWLVAVPMFIIVAWVLYVGGPQLLTELQALARNVRHYGGAIAITLSALLIAAGLPLFARGIEEFEVSAASARRAERWARRRN